MLSRKFKFQTMFIAFTAIFSAPASASESGDRHNLTGNVLGNAVGLFNLEYSYKVADHLTVGLTGYTGQARIVDYQLNGSSYGAIARYYFEPAFKTDSWYLVAAAEKRNFEATLRKDGTDFKGEMKSVVGSTGVGYQWFWNSFNIGFGVMATTQPDVALTDRTGQEFGESLSNRVNLDFTIGGKF